jgi:pyruvate/2-oxoglutarate dehydrogenase complex dihydrolipoamide dehydrogenase (E3) component
VFKHVVNVNEEGVIVIDYSRRKLHSDIYAAGDVSQADGHAGRQVHCHPHGRGGV